MPYWDRNAPLPEHDDRIIPWAEAEKIVLDAYRAFSPELADGRPEVLRHRLDRRAGAAGQVAGRLRPSDRAVGASLSAAELPGQGAGRHDARARAGPRRAPGAGGAAGRADGRHAAHAGRDRLGVRRDADLPVAARDRARQVDAQGDAGRQGRGHAEHRGAPDRLLRFRIAPAHGAPPGRADARRDRRDLDGGAEREPGAGLHLRRRVQALLVVHRPLHPFAVLRLCLRLRRLPGELALRRLPVGPAGLPGQVSRHAEGGRREAAQGAAGAVRPRRLRSGLLGQGPGRDLGLRRRAREASESEWRHDSSGPARRVRPTRGDSLAAGSAATPGSAPRSAGWRPSSRASAISAGASTATSMRPS